MSGINIPTWFIEQYKGNIVLLAQQQMSRFERCVTTGGYTGNGAAPVDQVGQVDATHIISRFTPIVRLDAPTDRRWIYPNDYEVPQFVDSFDKLKLATDPNGALVKVAHAALNRAKDDNVIGAFFATSATGVKGASTAAFDTTNYRVAVTAGASAATGMNVEKLKQARRMLRGGADMDDAEFDMDPMYCAISALQEYDLLGEVRITSGDYNRPAAPVLQDGRLMSFVGFNFIHSERLDVTADPYRRCPAWLKSGMHLGSWNDIYTSITEATWMTSHPIQVYAKGSVGATRLEETKVVDILCDE